MYLSLIIKSAIRRGYSSKEILVHFPIILVLKEATNAETTKVNNNKRSEIKALYYFIGIRFWVTK